LGNLLKEGNFENKVMKDTAETFRYWGLDRTGSGSGPVYGFCVSGTEHMDCNITVKHYLELGWELTEA